MNRKITTSIIAQAKVMKQNGKTLKEIAAELGVNKYTIQFYLKDVPSPNNKRLTDEQKEEIVALTKNGLSTYQIADKLEISQKTVCHILKKTLAKEKEPATAATVTDSVEIKTDDSEISNTVSISKDNTIEPKSQEQTDKLQGVNVLAVLENTLNDWLGIVGMGMIDPQATIVELSASVDDAAVTFEYKGERYFLAFGRR